MLVLQDVPSDILEMLPSLLVLLLSFQPCFCLYSGRPVTGVKPSSEEEEEKGEKSLSECAALALVGMLISSLNLALSLFSSNRRTNFLPALFSFFLFSFARFSVVGAMYRSWVMSSDGLALLSLSCICLMISWALASSLEVTILE